MILPILLLALTADVEVLSVVPTKTEVQTDESYSFTVRVRNHGPDAAEGTKVTMGTNAISLLRRIEAPPEWTCDAPGPRFGYTLACTTPALAAGAEAELKMTLAAPQPRAVTYRAGANATTKSTDPKRDGNRREVNLALLVAKSNAELTLTPRAATDKERVTFDLRNEGPDDARDVLVVLENAAMASGKGWTCAPSATAVVCTQPLLRAKTAASISARGADSAKITANARAEKNYSGKR